MKNYLAKFQQTPSETAISVVKALADEPSKPSKPGFVGFDGSPDRDIQSEIPLSGIDADAGVSVGIGLSAQPSKPSKLSCRATAEPLASPKPTVWLRWPSIPEFCPLELCGGRLVSTVGRQDRATCAKCGIHFELERGEI